MIKTRLTIAAVVLSILAAACTTGTLEDVTPTIAPGTQAPTNPTEEAPRSSSSTTGARADASIETVSCDDAPEESVIVCEAYDLIQANYVDDVADDDLIAAAIQGLLELPTDGPPGSFVCPLPSESFIEMCEAAAGRTAADGTLAEVIVSSFDLFGLDPNSIYLDQDALALLQEEQQGQIEGIGALVSPEDETLEGDNKQCAIISDTCNVVIASTIEGTPAEAAGLRSGDVIIAVGGEDIIGWTIEELTARVRGPAGTDVTLTILRNACLLYASPSPRDLSTSRVPSSA